MARDALPVEIVKTLRSHGHLAYLVGGCVRDRLLGIEPKDFDISTDAVPEIVLSYFPQSQFVGTHFGVVLVGSPNGMHVEVATFRSEDVYSDGRRPDQVAFETDPRLDAIRRDFTINALMEDPLSGEILDYTGGRGDLARQVIRAIGDPRRRFQEDHLRMLRAVRFAARLNFSIDPATMAAIQDLAPAVNRISAERARDELLRMLTGPNPRRAFELLDETALLQHVLPEVKAFQGVQQPPDFHPEGDVWNHVLLMLESLPHSAPATLALGVLLHDVGKPPTFRIADRIRFDGHAEVGAALARQILARLKLPHADTDRVVALVANHMRFKDVRQMRLSTLKRFLNLPDFAQHLELHRLDCLASNGYTDAYRFVQDKLHEFSHEELQPPRLLTGEDLIAAGYRPGPSFGAALEAVTVAQLDGEIHSREQALAIAQAVLDRNCS